MAGKKTRKIVMTADRYAHPTMGDLAKGAAEFVAPRTVEDGVTLANVLGDIGEMTPFAGAVPFVEDRLNLRNYDDETIAIMAMLGLLPFAGKITRKVNSLVPNPQGGFIRNPSFRGTMTKSQREATDQAVREWTQQAKKANRGRNPQPQSLPPVTEFEQPNVNKINDYMSRQFKFKPTVNDMFGLPKENPNVVTQAILPENLGEAAWLRHNYNMSNYDQVLHSIGPTIKKYGDEGLIDIGIGRSRTVPDPKRPGMYRIQYRTVDNNFADQGDRAKRDMLLKMEELFPGYLESMLKSP